MQNAKKAFCPLSIEDFILNEEKKNANVTERKREREKERKKERKRKIERKKNIKSIKFAGSKCAVKNYF